MAETIPQPAIQTVKLPDGTQAFILDQEQLSALTDIIEDRLWWRETTKRIQKFGILVVAAGVTLGWLASWLPWIIQTALLLLQGVPR